MSKVLIIDDEQKLRQLMSRIIGVEGDGFLVLEAANLKSARTLLKQQEIDVILCDVKLPDGSGIDFIAQIKEIQPYAEVVLFTAFGNIPDGVSAIKLGAFDYLTKGDDNHKIIPVLHRAAEKVTLAKRVAQLEAKTFKKYAFENILGDSPVLNKAISLSQKVAPLETSVLLLGETGTGKEVFANAIHFASRRKNKNFVAINCAAFSRDLLESELFGYKAGAFTGALSDKKGLIEEADKGTLFLDEIGEMPTALQAKLLRLLESGEYLKIGDTKVSQVDIRVIAATNRVLETEIEQGNFREDLYYRLSTFQLKLPALRDRPQDIPELANVFAESFSLKIGRKDITLSKEYTEQLQLFNWKGNVRELKNVVERSVITASGNILQVDDLPHEIAQLAEQNRIATNQFSLAAVEHAHIRKVCALTGGNKAEAARLLEIGLSTLYRKIEEYGLK
ncbi:sigma-54-dependent transcriptional regulator [Sphingobacterium deserti]|uniref:Two component, sigma54 specific, transcriptional regulator, fis family n=1 Tax=Sphingobacterium deserti TaxID=1229276 RepID=A0A0B8T546_9SPHI|nr:sigma-54 dependent transcriptional regulator [Sphingobacterium deserti]KGE12549.1 two component, sigma54 specific, transcriptional regulator, fis family [Sphingobacterium deserti]